MRCDGCNWADVSEETEVCDNIDNDCDGTIDEGNFVKNINSFGWDTIRLSGSKEGIVKANKKGGNKYTAVKRTSTLSDCDEYSEVGLRYGKEIAINR